MIDGKRVIVVTPAGRRVYLELLIKHINRLKGLVDEYHLWLNTTNQADIDYMRSIANDYIKVIESPGGVNGNMSIHRFFPTCTEANTVYIRFDDDVVFLDSNEAFTNFVRYRIAHPEYFLVYSNIINNSVVSHIHQLLGNISTSKGLTTYACMCEIGWKNPQFAENVHREFLSKKPSDFYFKQWLLHGYQRVSINSISWLGEEFAKFGGVVGPDEELWLSVEKPRELGKMNCVYGDFVCVHYAFFTQRDHLHKTDILNQYAIKGMSKFKDVFYYADIEASANSTIFKGAINATTLKDMENVRLDFASGKLYQGETVLETV